VQTNVGGEFVEVIVRVQLLAWKDGSSAVFSPPLMAAFPAGPAPIRFLQFVPKSKFVD